MSDPVIENASFMSFAKNADGSSRYLFRLAGKLATMQANVEAINSALKTPQNTRDGSKVFLDPNYYTPKGRYDGKDDFIYVFVNATEGDALDARQVFENLVRPHLAGYDLVPDALTIS